MTTDNTSLFYALFVPYFYIQIYANFCEVSPNISNYLLAILNVMNILSRVLSGVLADRYGAWVWSARVESVWLQKLMTDIRLKNFIPASAICTVLILGVWLPSRNTGSIVAFSALYGLFSGQRSSKLTCCVGADAHQQGPSSPCLQPTLRALPHVKFTVCASVGLPVPPCVRPLLADLLTYDERPDNRISVHFCRDCNSHWHPDGWCNPQDGR